MEQLSQEVIDLIATFIERYAVRPISPRWERKVSNLPRYSIISQAWKHAIERIAFRKIILDSIHIDAFDTILRGDRRRFLKDLTLRIEIPSYYPNTCNRLERAAERKTKNEVFTTTIAKLLFVLKRWEEDGLTEGSVRFEVWGIFERPQIGEPKSDTPQQNRFEEMIASTDNLKDHRCTHSLTHLLRIDRLPSIHRVSTVIFDSNPVPNLAPQAVVDMTATFPNLEHWGCRLYDVEKLYPRIRVTDRHNFASAFSGCTFPSLKTVDIRFFHEAPLNQNMKPADLRSGQSYDPLSTALRMTFSQCPILTSLTLSGVFDSSLFWPPSEQTAHIPTLNCWPNLQFLTVVFDTTAPSGHWYFTGPGGHDPEQEIDSLPVEDDGSVPNPAESPFFDDVEHRILVQGVFYLTGIEPVTIFRTEPNPIHLNPLILAFAKLVKNTSSPCLRKAALTTGRLSSPKWRSFPSNMGDHFRFEICYYAPNEVAYYGDEEDEDVRLPRLYLEVGERFPNEEVLKSLEEAGWRHWGAELLVRFLQSQYQKLVV